MLVKGGGDFVHGQADDIAHRALDAVDDEGTVILGRIGARLVHRIDAGVVVGLLGGRELFEMDAGGHGEIDGLSGVSVSQGDSGEDLVGTPVERGEHPRGLLTIGRFAEDGVAEEDERVRCDDDGLGEPG